MIIILALRPSWTSKARLEKTLFMVSTTLWKLLAAPFSCVKRVILRWLRRPCSMTVIISTAKWTSLMLRTIKAKGQRMFNMWLNEGKS